MRARASAFAPRVSAESSGRRVFSSTPHVSRVGASRSSLGSRPSARVRAASESSDTLESVVITAEALTPEAFAPFGQVISAEEDGAEFGPDDAQLDLSQGTPRFYIMRLRDKAMRFDRITYHGKVTQCLGALGDHSWYMAVAAPPCPSSADPPRGDIHVFEFPRSVRQDARRHVARGTSVGLHRRRSRAHRLLQPRAQRHERGGSQHARCAATGKSSSKSPRGARRRRDETGAKYAG